MVRKPASLVLMAALISLLLVGCGGATAPQPSTAPSTKPSAVSSAAPSAAASSPAASQAAIQPPKTPAELAVYQGPDRQRLLEEGARKEGKLSRYTIDVGTTLEAMTNGFKAKYPFVQLEVFRANAMDLGTKVTQESQAGQNVFDVIDGPPNLTSLLAESKLLMPYYSPSLVNVPEGLRTSAGKDIVEKAVTNVAYVGFGYNTTLIPESALPKTFQDLLSPSLTGKMAIPGSTTVRRWMGLVLQSMGEAKGKQLLDDLATKQKVTVQQVSGGALLDLIAKGEIPASPSVFSMHVRQAQAKGGPVKWIPLESVTMDAYEIALAAKAPHPHAALLFLDFVLSKEGRQIYKDNFGDTGAEQETFKYWIPEKGRTTAQMDSDLKGWDTLFKGLFLR